MNTFLKNFFKYFLVIGIIFSFSFVSAQSNASLWKLLSGKLIPVNNSWQLRIPSLNSSGTKCLHVDAIGLVSSSSSDCISDIDLNNKVPYTGATQNVDIGNYSFISGLTEINNSGGIRYNNLDAIDVANKQYFDNTGTLILDLSDKFRIVDNISSTAGILNMSSLSVERTFSFQDKDGIVALSGDNISTFNNDVGYILPSRTISTTAPLQGGGDLSTDRTLSITQASTSTDGYLSSTDWNTFNNKENALTFSTGLTRATNTITANLSTGVSGGQSVIGGTASGNNLTLSSTSHATKGKLLFGTSAYDEVNNRLGLGTTTPAEQLELTGSMRLPRTTSSSLGIIYKGTSRFFHDYTNVTGGGDGSGRNIFLGLGAGNFTSSSGGTGYLGSGNIGIGGYTLSALTTGYGNIAIGQQVLSSNTTGNLNVGIGHQALLRNTTGYYNLALGYGTLFNNTTGHQNAAFGFSSLYQNTTGNDNFAFGNPAMNLNTTGSNNLAFGNYSGHSNQTSSNNLAIGHYSAYYSTGGTNMSFGNYSLYTNSSGFEHTVIGYFSFYSNTTGYRNIGLGVNSGRDVTTGAKNTIIGYNTGRGITTGNSNTIIGSNVTGLSTSLSNNIILSDGDGNIRIQTDNNGHTTFAGKVIAGNTMRLKNYTVATLPAGTAGDTAYVTDALAPTYLAVVVGGGAVTTPVFFNGTAWVAH